MWRSPSIEMRLPSVIALKEYVQAARNPAFTRFNVFLRDRFSCQYCGEPYPSHDLTFDHVVPRSRGGRTVWANVVTACSYCNLLKGNRLPQQSGMYRATGRSSHRASCCRKTDAPSRPTTCTIPGAIISIGIPSSRVEDGGARDRRL